MNKFLISLGKAVVIKVVGSLAVRGMNHIVNARKKRKEKLDEQSNPELGP